jgi:hypothetical protein
MDTSELVAVYTVMPEGASARRSSCRAFTAPSAKTPYPGSKAPSSSRVDADQALKFIEHHHRK